MDFETIIGKDISRDQKLAGGRRVAVGIPTETVYGLAGNALNPDAVPKIFAAKNRPHFDPLIVHTHSISEMRKYVKAVPPLAEKLMSKFMLRPY